MSPALEDSHWTSTQKISGSDSAQESKGWFLCLLPSRWTDCHWGSKAVNNGEPTSISQWTWYWHDSRVTATASDDKWIKHFTTDKRMNMTAAKANCSALCIVTVSWARWTTGRSVAVSSRCETQTVEKKTEQLLAGYPQHYYGYGSLQVPLQRNKAMTEEAGQRGQLMY